MKDQYFGDVNDYRKYGLLRSLTGPGRLRLGVCWMLTAPDGRTDGKFLQYLAQETAYRHRDAELFDWLRRVVGVERVGTTKRIEGERLLGDVVFQSAILADSRSAREAYFEDSAARFTNCDLVFLDPDNGVEVRSVACGRRNSCKYVYWNEVAGIFASGASVLVYQHFPRKERNAYTIALASEMRRRTEATAIFTFRTPRVLFVLAAQARHAGGFRAQIDAINVNWGPRDIVAAEL